MDGSGNAGAPPIVLDGRRAYWGHNQLTDRETAVLNLTRKHDLQLVFLRSEPTYFCNGKKVDRKVAERLIKRNYVLEVSPGLFPGAPGQTWRARPEGGR